jgi:hypothetical protein
MNRPVILEMGSSFCRVPVGPVKKGLLALRLKGLEPIYCSVLFYPFHIKKNQHDFDFQMHLMHLGGLGNFSGED